MRENAYSGNLRAFFRKWEWLVWRRWKWIY